MNSDLPEHVKRNLTALRVRKIEHPEKYGGLSKKEFWIRRFLSLILWPVGLIVGIVMSNDSSKVKAAQGREIIIGSLIVAGITIITFSTGADSGAGAGRAQTADKEKLAVIWNSEMMLREGVSDFPDNNLGDFFNSNDFKEEEALDGSVSTAERGAVTIEGNYFTIPLYITNNGVKQVTLLFRFLYMSSNNTALLEEVEVKNHETGEHEISESFSDKAACIVFLQELRK